jgi:hypothetical protein
VQRSLGRIANRFESRGHVDAGASDTRRRRASERLDVVAEGRADRLGRSLEHLI